jgi:hypothetical protein
VPDEGLTPDAWRARLDRITDLYSGMMDTAKSLEGRRCPYKNKDDRCTAKFGCRNQRVPPEGKGSGALQPCAGDDKLDWRSAWEAS